MCVRGDKKKRKSNHILFIHLRDFPVVTGQEAGCNVNQSQTQKKKNKKIKFLSLITKENVIGIKYVYTEIPLNVVFYIILFKLLKVSIYIYIFNAVTPALVNKHS